MFILCGSLLLCLKAFHISILKRKPYVLGAFVLMLCFFYIKSCYIEKPQTFLIPADEIIIAHLYPFAIAFNAIII